MSWCLRLSVAAALLVAVLVAGPVPGLAQPAFPGAEGFGAKATGGRGGAVLRVTTLAASGPGSLQWAVNQPGPRIVVFEVSGVIVGDVVIPHGDLTIAGQTAPGSAGITLHGHLVTPYGSTFGNLVIRHLRVRPPDPDAAWPPHQHDAIQLSTNHTMILDHVDASHAADEILDLWGGARDVTVQWSAFTHPIYDPANGWTHNKGLLSHDPCADDGSCDPAAAPGGRISIHHNLFVHARNRTPAVAIGPAEVVGNVVYNGREGFVHHNRAGGDFNLIANVYLAGPSIALAPLWIDPENPTTPIPTRYWSWDNRVDDPGRFVGRFDHPYTTPGFAAVYSIACCGVVPSQFDGPGPFDFSRHLGYVPITTPEGDATLDRVLAGAGAFPRDIVSRWAIEDVRGRTGAWGNRRPADWLEGLVAVPVPPVDDGDADDDGMDDAWEQARGLDPADGTDHATVMPSGYTAIEEYVNGLADALVGGVIFVDDFESGNTRAWAGPGA